MKGNFLFSNPWKIIFLLFLANLLNFFDRTIPAVILENIRVEYNLNDMQLGFLAAAFAIVYALAGLYFGYLADKISRKKIIGLGLFAWSGFTAFNAIVWSYISFFTARVGVGIGESSYAPSANSLIGDLYPPEHRAKAIGIFMLGLPLGMILAFFSVGYIVESFGSWRAPFVIAAVPGFILSILFFYIKEPIRGGKEISNYSEKAVVNPILYLLKIKTLRWIILSGITLNFAASAGIAFLVPLFQRYFGLNLIEGSVFSGCIIGVTGLIGLTFGGIISDKIHKKYKNGRLIFGSLSMLISTLLVALGLLFGIQSLPIFVLLFSVGWLFLYNYYTTIYPAIQDIVEPNMRATAIGLYFACISIFGGALGPLVVGALSDYFSSKEMILSGTVIMIESYKALGLYRAFFLVPIMLLLTSIFVYFGSNSFYNDSLLFRNKKN